MPVRQSILIILVLGCWGCDISDPKQMTRDIQGQRVTCPASTTIQVSSTNPIVTVSYTEPTRNVDGTPLIDLSKTTIYFDLGNGSVKAMDVPATRPTGGGYIRQPITVPVRGNDQVRSVVCVTATDVLGNEGPPAE